jgi:hypothetical protein
MFKDADFFGDAFYFSPDIGIACKIIKGQF